MSIYANFGTEFAAWQSTRTEVAQVSGADHLDESEWPWYARPRVMKRYHGWAVVFWAINFYVGLVFYSHNVLYLALISVYANFSTHFGAWQAARTEVREEQIQGMCS